MGKNSALDKLKYEVSQELGYINAGAQNFSPQNANYEISGELSFFNNQTASTEYSNYLNNTKFEIANELGIPLTKGYNGDITSRDAGRIGGRVGGKIGGNMVRKMVEYAEQNMPH